MHTSRYECTLFSASTGRTPQAKVSHSKTKESFARDKNSPLHECTNSFAHLMYCCLLPVPSSLLVPYKLYRVSARCCSSSDRHRKKPVSLNIEYVVSSKAHGTENGPRSNVVFLGHRTLVEFCQSCGVAAHGREPKASPRPTSTSSGQKYFTHGGFPVSTCCFR